MEDTKKIQEVINKLDDRDVTSPRQLLKEQHDEINKFSGAYKDRDYAIVQCQYDMLLQYGLDPDDTVAYVDENNSKGEEGPAIAWGDECLILFMGGDRVARTVWSCRGNCYSVHIEGM